MAFLKPAEGKVVAYFDKSGRQRYLPVEGAEVGQLTTFWRRRIDDGDVVEAKPAKPAATKKDENKQEGGAE